MAFRFPFKFSILARVVSMTVITVFAALLMIAINLKPTKIEQEQAETDQTDQPANVSLMLVKSGTRQIRKRYSGIIRPFERYQLSFKTTGRLVELGVNEKGKPLDEGDSVTAGMLLAKLDNRLLQAQKTELEASRDFAKIEYEKAAALRQGTGAISESEFNRRKSEWEIAEAKLDILKSQMEDTVLKSEVSGIISKRLAKPGESVNLGQTVFELIQVEKVKLIVGVPESKVRRLIRKTAAPLKAKIKLIGKDHRGKIEYSGEVFRVGQTSDDKSGLFEVEILIDNQEGTLRPGMIAIADIMVDSFDGFQIPADAAFFHSEETFVFAIDHEEYAKWLEDKQKSTESDSETNLVLCTARKLVIKETEMEVQGDHLMLRSFPDHLAGVIVAGHRRLVDNRSVNIVEDIPAATGTGLAVKTALD